jgi:MoxR-like ATPase
MSASSSPSTAPRWSALIEGLGHGLLERDEAVRLSLLAALAGEHVLLIGPPGTAKSALARRLHGAFADAPYFERLLTRFSTPEELFGPLSLKALEEDRYERLTAGFLPTAGIAFLDEVFKANSAILNALLTLLNEREFDNGTQRLRTPLVAVVAASNEVPQDEGLQAFHDRFLVRLPVAPVGDASFGTLLRLPSHEAGDPSQEVQPITAAERLALAGQAALVALGQDFIDACAALRRELAAKGRPMSDRRWRQFVGLARIAAACEGRDALDALDLWLAPYVAATKPEDAPPLATWFTEEVLAAPPERAPWLERAVEAFERQLGIEESAPTEDGDDSAGKLALARAIGLGQTSEAQSEPGAQRFVSSRLEEQLVRRYGALHVHTRVAQVDEVLADVRAALVGVNAQRAALTERLQGRLWIPPSLSAVWLRRFDIASALLTQLAMRLEAARTGFAALPLDPAEPSATPPPPVALTEAGGG